MPPQSIIIHERRGYWSRQLRPRFRGSSIRWSESRLAADLARPASRSASPILLIDLADDPILGLEALDAGVLAAPMALSLVLDPRSDPEISSTAKDLGATLVLRGVVVPPDVVHLLHRWLPIAQERAEAEGWSAPIEVESDPRGPLNPLALMETLLTR